MTRAAHLGSSGIPNSTVNDLYTRSDSIHSKKNERLIRYRRTFRPSHIRNVPMTQNSNPRKTLNSAF